MRKPTKFKSGFYNWKIVWSKEKTDELFGKTDIITKTVTIYKQDNEEIERETLFHELMHVVGEDKYDAIFSYEPEKKELDREENLIRLLSPSMMQMFSDNKDLSRFLFKL
tara:strand:- start:118 stop:447 length:330 start_codon:yes stop_codon:yes gene_type:complete